MSTTYTLTGNLADLLGVDIPGSKIEATVGTNMGNLALVDLDNNKVHPPKSPRLAVGEDGSFSVTLIATNSSGINVLDGSLRYIVRASYSDGRRGKINWDSGYFELTANADLSDKVGTGVAVDVDAATAMVSTLVEQEVQNHTPGIELGYASRTSSVTSTATTSGAATNLAGLSVTVVGQGRPVDLRFHCPSVYHTTANAGVSVVIVRDGNITGGDNQIGATFSPVTTTGPSMAITRRTATLVNGVSYTFTVRAWGTVAGTCTLVGAAFCPIELVVTSR